MEAKQKLAKLEDADMAEHLRKRGEIYIAAYIETLEGEVARLTKQLEQTMTSTPQGKDVNPPHSA